jgi:hypothetical protein
MKLHYFEQDRADSDDMNLGMAKMQKYVPETCLLGGMVVMGLVDEGKDPCRGCHGPREKCHGRSI